MFSVVVCRLLLFVVEGVCRSLFSVCCWLVVCGVLFVDCSSFVALCLLFVLWRVGVC